MALDTRPMSRKKTRIDLTRDRPHCEALEPRFLLAAAGLVAAYGFEDGSGSLLGDSSGNANTGTITGATWTSGRFGSALSFNGVDNLVTVADSGSLDLTTSLTLAAWVYPTASTGVRDIIIKEGANVDVYNLYARNGFGLPESNVLVGGTNVVAQGSALAINTWTYVVGTYDGTSLNLYLDGALAASQPLSGPIAVSTGALRIGGNGIWGEHFQGRIDEVRIYDRALSAAEIQFDMTVPVSQSAPDLTPPKVTALTPVNGATTVSVSSNLTVTFNEAMLASSINSATIELRTPAGTIVPATVSYNPTSRVATLDPTSNIAAVADAYYSAVVRGGAAGVKDAAGNGMIADVSWSFTTGTPTFQDVVVKSGLDEPTSIEFASDGRVFIAERSGLIKVFDSLSDPTATIFADLRTNVHNFWDRGLLGMALAPTFPIDPYVYVLYTLDADIGGTPPKFGTPGTTSDPGPNATTTGATVSARLSRLQANGNVMTGQEQVLINDWFQQFPSHSIGALRFGPDGALYASAGDGAHFNYADYGQTGNPGGDPANQGGALRSQDLRTPTDPTTLDGTIIRVDPVTGQALPTNPLFATGNDANAKRIIAYGLRNPFRFAFRPGTNEIWIADVGWNLWEEINRVANAADPVVENFGWPAYEGNARQSSYDALNLPLLESLYASPNAVTSPYYAYAHASGVVPGSGEPTGSSAVTGVAFYTGTEFPDAFRDALIFADFARGRIYTMFRGPDGSPDPTNRRVLSVAATPVEIKLGPGGELYYIEHEGTGAIRQIRYLGANRPPVASLVADRLNGPSPLTVNFTAAGSSDPDPGDTLSFAWDLDDDGQFDDSTAVAPSTTFVAPGNHTVRLRVTDNHGATTVTSVVISVNNTPPSVVIDLPLTTLRHSVNEMIDFAATATDPEDGPLAAAAFEWELLIHHGTHTHHVQDFVGLTAGTIIAPDHEYPSFLELIVTVTDSGGLQATAAIDILPRLVTLNFAASPPGLRLAVGGTAELTPFSRQVIAGSENLIGAISPQVSGTTVYLFSNWSDGGAESHSVVAPVSGGTYTATFAPAPGPVAAYAFDESEGNVAFNSRGNADHGVITDAIRVAGRFGSALRFNGTGSLVTVPDSDALDLTTGMTLQAWILPDTASGVRDVVMKEGESVGVYNLYHRDNAGNPSVRVLIAGQSRATDGPPIAAGGWTHLAATYDGATLRLYMNGVEVGAAVATEAIAVSSGPLRIGGNSIWGEHFSGLIDEVRIYNRALHPMEIVRDMTTPILSGKLRKIVQTPREPMPESAPATFARSPVVGLISRLDGVEDDPRLLSAALPTDGL